MILVVYFIINIHCGFILLQTVDNQNLKFV